MHITKYHPVTVVIQRSAVCSSESPNTVVGQTEVLLECFAAAIDQSREKVLDAVFDRNPYHQRGGWYLRLAKLLAIDLQAHPAYTLLFTGPSEAIACIRHVA